MAMRWRQRDRAALAAALARNVAPEDPAWAGADALACHVVAVADALARQDDETILAGRIEFVPAQPAEARP
jgi:cytochrome b pre-mRNA-processing protein 3